MILKGFEIENWGCIKKLSIAGLPSSGVIVLWMSARVRAEIRVSMTWVRVASSMSASM